METGTLKEIGAQLGDQVQCVESGSAWACYKPGANYIVGGKDNAGLPVELHETYATFRIISRAAPTAPTGPVRTVTRKEIVPGEYGNVEISHHKEISVSWMNLEAHRIRAAIATLTEIADAMEESQ